MNNGWQNAFQLAVAISQKRALHMDSGRRVQVLYQESGALRQGFHDRDFKTAATCAVNPIMNAACWRLK